MPELTTHMNFAISLFVGGVSFIIVLLIKIPVKMLTSRIAAKHYPDYSERIRKRAGGGSSGPASGPASGSGSDSDYGSDPFSVSVEEKVAEYKCEREECIRIFRRRLNFIIIVITFGIAVFSYGLMLDIFHEEHFKLCYALKGGCMAISLYAVFEQFFGSPE